MNTLTDLDKKIEQYAAKATSYEKMADEMAALGDVHAERHARRMASTYREDIEEILKSKKQS